MQLHFNIQLQKDEELLYKAGTADTNPVPGRVVVNRFLLWVPRLTPKDSLYEKFTDSFLIPITWKYNREMYQVSQPRQVSGFSLISPSIDNVQAVFAYLQREKTKYAGKSVYF